jgi:hypothetical protein
MYAILVLSRGPKERNPTQSVTGAKSGTGSSTKDIRSHSKAPPRADGEAVAIQLPLSLLMALLPAWRTDYDDSQD